MPAASLNAALEYAARGWHVYPVNGKVVFENGEPLTTGGVVLCESLDTLSDDMAIMARGKIREDGTFELSTFADGDGAVVGKHRVLVSRPSRRLLRRRSSFRRRLD